MQKKKLAAILALSLTLSTVLSGYAFQEGIGNIYYESNREIASQTYIKEQIAGHIQNGIEHAYMVNSDELDGLIQPYVFSGEVAGKYTLSSMIDWIEQGGYRVVAGINGDLYDTATGTPKGLTVHNSKIKSSGYAPDRVLAFDESGAASLAAVNLTYTAKANNVNGEIPMQINYFNVPHGGAKGLHLFNRQYASTTKTSGNCRSFIGCRKFR